MEQNNTVKEVRIKMNTGETGLNTVATDKVNGILKGMIVSSSGMIDIIIESELGYVLFKDQGRSGTNYFGLSIDSLNDKAEKRNFTDDNFHLNERIKIIVSGPINTDVYVIFRLI